MKRKYYLIAAMAAALMLTSCATKQSAVNSLRSFQQEIETNGAFYSLSDWKKAAQDYAKINKKVFKHYKEYSAEELEEIGRINAECATSFAKGAAQNVGSKVQGAASLIKGLVEGVKQSVESAK